MLTFDVVKEQHGWGIRMDQRMTTHFRSRNAAVHQAHLLAAAIRRHGVRTMVIVDGADHREAPNQIEAQADFPRVHLAMGVTPMKDQQAR